MPHSYHITVETRDIIPFSRKIGILRAETSLTVNAQVVYNIGHAEECILDRRTVPAQSYYFLPYHKAPFRSMLSPSLDSRVESMIWPLHCWFHSGTFTVYPHLRRHWIQSFTKYEQTVRSLALAFVSFPDCVQTPGSRLHTSHSVKFFRPTFFFMHHSDSASDFLHATSFCAYDT